jgi:hypothetical protein
VPIPADQVDYLIATAARAPSVHNTQPWRFRAGHDAIELYADQRRKLRVDPVGREMLISCGAALFGLRLAVRSLGYLPMVELLPDPARLRLLARVRLGRKEPMTGRERQMLAALPHRHTHRGPFAPGPLPTGLLAGLQHDALAEGATLALIDPVLAYQRLADIVGAAGRRRDLSKRPGRDVAGWSRDVADPARDGVPAHAFTANASRQPGAAAAGDLRPGPRPRACSTTAGRQPARHLRRCSRPATAGPTGSALAGRCTSCWHTPQASGCSPACTHSRWRPPRSAP